MKKFKIGNWFKTWKQCDVWMLAEDSKDLWEVHIFNFSLGKSKIKINTTKDFIDDKSFDEFFIAHKSFS